MPRVSWSIRPNGNRAIQGNAGRINVHPPETTIMRKQSFVLLGLLILAAGCSSGLKSQILGKWEPQEEGLKGKGVVMEITASEIRTSGPTGMVVASPYRFVADNTIETETSMLGQTF